MFRDVSPRRTLDQCWVVLLTAVGVAIALFDLGVIIVCFIFGTDTPGLWVKHSG